MCRAGWSAARRADQQPIATKRNATCFHDVNCIHGLQCWGVHTAAAIELFRQREGLAQAAGQCSPRDGFSGVVAVCRKALFSEARRWLDGKELAASKDEFYDAELIPRRRAHRRLRKRQRAQHRKQQRQQRRRAHVIKFRWLNILAKGDKRRQIQQQQQQHHQQQQCEQLEQKGVEMEAAEALLQEAGEVQAILKRQVTQLRSKVERQEADLRQQQDLQQQQQQQQCHRKPWEWSEDELLELVDQQESELETASRMSAEQDQQQQQSWLKISEQNLQMAEQQVHIETLERLLGVGVGVEVQASKCSDLRAQLVQCEASTQCSSTEIEGEVAHFNRTEAEKTVAHAVAQEREIEEEFWAKCRTAGDAAVVQYWQSAEATAGEEETQVGKHKNWCELAKVDRGVLSRELASAARLGCTCGALDRQDKEQRKRDRNRNKRNQKREKKRGDEAEMREFKRSINADPFMDC